VPARDGFQVRSLPSRIVEGAFVSVTLRLDVAREIGHGQLALFAMRDRSLPSPDAWDSVMGEPASGETDDDLA
jgi:hypothetical protein